MRRDRAWRRAQRLRKIERVRRWMRDRNLRSGNQVTAEESRQTYLAWARRRHSAPACCSGFCCGNQRRHEGPTLAELRAEDSALSWLADGDGSVMETQDGDRP
jgi:hypothetical protein